MSTKDKQKKVLTSEAEYKKAIARTIEIFNAKDGTPEAHELDLFLVLVKDFEDKNIIIPNPID